MPESFIVAEEEHTIFFDGSTRAGAELISAEWSDRTLIEEIPRVERTVAQKFEDRSVELVCSRLRDDGHLRACTLSVLGGVCSCQYIEFANGVDSQQIPAHAAGSDRKLARAVYSIPFIKNRFSSGRRPATENVLPWLVTVPGLL